MILWITGYLSGLGEKFSAGKGIEKDGLSVIFHAYTKVENYYRRLH